MDDQLTDQIQLQLDDLLRAHTRLKEALVAEKTELNRDAAIQRFEFTFELVWKVLKNVNLYFGRECSSPRECFRLAAQNELLTNPEEWFNYNKETIPFTLIMKPKPKKSFLVYHIFLEMSKG